MIKVKSQIWCLSTKSSLLANPAKLHSPRIPVCVCVGGCHFACLQGPKEGLSVKETTLGKLICVQLQIADLLLVCIVLSEISFCSASTNHPVYFQTQIGISRLQQKTKQHHQAAAALPLVSNCRLSSENKLAELIG